MKRYFTVISLFVMCSLTFLQSLSAQEKKDSICLVGNENVQNSLIATEPADDRDCGIEKAEPLSVGDDGLTRNGNDVADSDSLTIPVEEGDGLFRPTLFTLSGHYAPFGGGGLWNIHDGLNVSIDMGVTVGWGKNNPFRGGSFFTDFSLLYAKKVSDKLTMALGGTLSRFKLWNSNVFSGAIDGLLNYAFNDHLSATVFGSYNYSPTKGVGITRSGLPFVNRCAEIGAELTYKFNDFFSVSMSVSETTGGNGCNGGCNDMPPKPNNGSVMNIVRSIIGRR